MPTSPDLAEKLEIPSSWPVVARLFPVAGSSLERKGVELGGAAY